jgi:hypothetical protein
MDKMTDDDWRELADAVVLWTGKGDAIHPDRSDSRLTVRYGAERAAKLLAVIKKLEVDFYSSDAWQTADLAEMGEHASAQFLQKYSLLPARAVEAFAWCYTWDHK